MGHVDAAKARDLRRNSLQMREIGLHVGFVRLEISFDSRLASARVCFHLTHFFRTPFISFLFFPSEKNNQSR